MDAVMTPDPDFAYAQSGYAMPVADRERRPSAGDLRDRLDDAVDDIFHEVRIVAFAVMRITGSVPDGRTMTRPWPLRRSVATVIADRTDASSSGLPLR